MLNIKGENIILVTLDGLRKDKVDLIPSLKSLKKSSSYFSNMFTVSPYTFTAHHAIFSGMYPSRNGVDAYCHNLDFKKEQISTLTEF